MKAIDSSLIKFYQSRIFWVWAMNILLGLLAIWIALSVGSTVMLTTGGVPVFTEATKISYTEAFKANLGGNGVLTAVRLGSILGYVFILLVNLIMITGKSPKKILQQWHQPDHNNSPVLYFALSLMFAAWALIGTGLGKATGIDILLRLGMYHTAGTILSALLNRLTGIKSFSAWGNNFEMPGTDSGALTTICAYAIAAMLFLVV